MGGGGSAEEMPQLNFENLYSTTFYICSPSSPVPFLPFAAPVSLDARIVVFRLPHHILLINYALKIVWRLLA